MNKHSIYRQPLAIILSLCLILPGAALGMGKSGKKNFNAGFKYEAAQQWDLAVQEYALAVAAEPGNAEYRLHLVRALLNASLMFMKRGDALAEQKDYASAYNAYRQGAVYDPTNELARLKLTQMIERQKALSGLGTPVNYNAIGNVIQTSGDINVAQKQRQQKEVAQLIEFKDQSLKEAIKTIAKELKLNVIFDESFREPPGNKFSISLQNTTMAKAFDYILLSNKMAFEQLDRRTILIYGESPTNRQRFEKMMVKTFYLGNADASETRNLVQQMLGASGGQQRQFGFNKALNALVVRASLPDLNLIQDILESLDKNKAEVVLDVNIYEVSNTSSLAIGNQLATSGQQVSETRYGTDGKPFTVNTGTSASLDNLGGIGRLAAIAGNITTPFLGGVGTVFGLPPTSLSLLQTKGNSKLLANAQVHALDGEAGQTVVGQSIPVRTGTNYLGGYGNTGAVPGQAGAATSALTGGGINSGGGAFDNIQYKDVGLVIDVTPTITNEGYVQIKMKLESSNVESSGTDANLTPRFTKRQLTTVSRVQDGQTAIVAGVKQENKGESRASIPIIGMVPILGRFLSTPKQTSELTDLVITVTPHIIRTAEIKQVDHLARYSGTAGAGLTQTIEDVMLRAQAEDDQDRRVIAMQLQQQQQAQPNAAPGTPLGTTLTTAALVAETTAPMTTPAPKVETPNFTAPAPALVNTATSGLISGLTPPPAASALQPESKAHAANQIPMQNVSLTNPASPPATGNSGSSVQSSPAMPVTSSSISGVVDSANTTPVVKSQPTPPPNQAAQTKPPSTQSSTPPAVGPAKVQPVSRTEKGGTNAARKPDSDPAKEETPVRLPDDFVPPVVEGPKEPVAPAGVKMRPTLKNTEESDGASGSGRASAKSGGANRGAGSEGKAKEEMAMELSLLCQPKQQVGKSFIVVVSLTGEAQITGASVSLKYDPALLQVKAVRDGGLLGSQAEVTHQDAGGSLTINAQQSPDKTSPVVANGKLVVIEFTATEAGETSLEFNNSETKFTLAEGGSPKINAAPTKLEISREAVSKLNK